ncbi:response regulator [Dokdonella sp.]|uniref:response regulator n=1 Tax=Dokdonella sp. TaxID=2291710 RepID=UPI003529C2CD
MARILVADDNALSLEFFAESISRMGHVAETARDGMEACLLASSRHYDLMLIDSRMPLLGGADALRRIRSRSGPSRSSPAVATTADASPGSDDLLDAGFSTVVIKPIMFEDLRAVIESQLATALARDEMLDDGLAMAKNGGQRDIMHALRKLFAAELDAIPGEIHALAASNDTVALRDRLHKLDASAGFCGAIKLAGAVRTLRDVLDEEKGWPNDAVDRFLAISAETRDSLG